MSDNYTRVVSIDGPSGSGKSTVAKGLADELDFLYVDTGAMYRGVALAFHEWSVDLNDLDEVKRALGKLELKYGSRNDQLIFINGLNRSEDIRQHFVSEVASRVSQLLPVREAMVSFQRELPNVQRERVCVMEGRDIGTVVFPGAFVKFFLSADEKVRAERRFAQLTGMDKTGMEYGQVLKDIVERDRKDSERKWAPLVKPEGAIEIDSTLCTVNEIIGEMKRCIISMAHRLEPCL